MNLHPTATFSKIERFLAFIAGLFNLVVGLIFFFLPEMPELRPTIWPVDISPVLDRFIGAIILGNSAGALWLSTEKEWARVRPLALVAVVYGTLVALGLLYHLVILTVPPKAAAFFWVYFFFDLPFLIVFYGLFLYHDLLPALRGDRRQQVSAHTPSERPVSSMRK
jgi:hypothetical protein